MPPLSSNHSARNDALYRSIVQDAASGGGVLLGKLVIAARADLHTREAASRDPRVRDALSVSGNQLRNWEPELCKRYPAALLQAFTHPEAIKTAGTRAISDLQFEDLELMDEVQVQSSVTIARTQHVAMMAADASLAELNTLICSVLGLGSVHAERNPLRPQAYISALKGVIAQTQLPQSTQLEWMGSMSQALGYELREMYSRLSVALLGQGVVAAGYAVTQTVSAVGVGRGIAQNWNQPGVGAPPVPQFDSANTSAAPRSQTFGEIASADDTLLTLDKLRRLLAGELESDQSGSRLENFALRFSNEFESGGSVFRDAPADFDATVPAALEALKEMNQVDQVVNRLQQRWVGHVDPVQAGDTTLEAELATLRTQAVGVAQSLSLEVVTLMIENIANDVRLLPPVQQLIRRLEPALSRVALVDPRLFTNKLHPARVLVQEVSHRSLAYTSVQTPGFQDFLSGLERAIAPVFQADLDGTETFDVVLKNLQIQWNLDAQTSERNRQDATKVLQRAEQRNLLAERIAREIDAHPDASRVPAAVVDFLCGPWAQVVAQARIDGLGSSLAADKYKALISALLWSTTPELTRKNTTKLTRLVPMLITTLREGLETIKYPFTKTSVFLETLMGLHQLAFKANLKPQPSVDVAEPALPVAASIRASLLAEGDPWVAPEEALASNFMELPDLPASVAPGSLLPDSFDNLPLGSWVELLVNGQWIRTQLTWASPHGTLFLFTSVLGTTQSMTRRSRDKLEAAGNLRVISGAPVVEGALNAVAQMALQNSLKSGH
jgi:hypothetical protein